MSMNGRAQFDALTNATGDEPVASGVKCAAGTPRYKPVSPDHRAALSKLIEMGRMIRRHDGSYGTPEKMMIPNKIATDLKGRRMIVAGFSSEIVPTDLGRRYNNEADHG